MTDNPQQGQTRRELLGRFAIAGTAAWVAPAVLDSVVNPAAAASGCTCSTAGSYTAAKLESIGTSAGGLCPPGGGATTVTGANGLTSVSNRCGTACWIATNGSPNLLTGAVPTYTCSTKTITLPTGCTFGAKGMVAVFFGGPTGGCVGNFFVETSLPAGYTCGSNGTNNAGTILSTSTTFVLTSFFADLTKLSHVNVIYCCC